MPTPTPNLTDLLNNNVISNSDVQEFQQTGSTSSSAKTNTQNYYSNNGSTEASPTSTSSNTTTTGATPVVNTAMTYGEMTPEERIVNGETGKNTGNIITNSVPTQVVNPIPTTLNTNNSTTGNTTPNTSTAGTGTISQADQQATDALANQNKILTDQQKNLGIDNSNIEKSISNDNSEYIKNLEQSRTDQQKLIDDANSKIDAIHQENLDREKQVLNDKNAQLASERDASVKAMEASKAQLELIDKQNIKNQEIANNVSEQQSAWAFGKLGLSFSSGAIIQAQQVAQNGAYSIALLQSKVVLDNANISKDIATLKSTYATQINDNIDKYSTIVSTYKEDAIKRINDATLNKLKTSDEILKEKKTVADNFRTTVLTLERQFREDQQNISNGLVTNTQAIQANSDKVKLNSLNNMNTQLNTGELLRMTPEQIAQKETTLGLSRGEIGTRINQGISTQIRGILDKIAGVNYISPNMNNLVESIKNEMSMNGRDLATATNIVMQREISTNKDLQVVVNEKKKQEYAKNNIDVYNAETNRMKALADIQNNNNQNAISNQKVNIEAFNAGMSNGNINSSSYYSNFGVSQGYGNANTPNKADVVKLANGTSGTPGNDYKMPENTPVPSTIDGVVVEAKLNGGYGNQVGIRDKDGNIHYYSHLNGFNVKEGDVVDAGTAIGISGGVKGNPGAGFSTGAHLDYRVKNSKGEWIDPTPFANSMGTENANTTINNIEKFKSLPTIKDMRDTLKAIGVSSSEFNNITNIDALVGMYKKQNNLNSQSDWAEFLKGNYGQAKTSDGNLGKNTQKRFDETIENNDNFSTIREQLKDLNPEILSYSKKDFGINKLNPISLVNNKVYDNGLTSTEIKAQVNSLKDIISSMENSLIPTDLSSSTPEGQNKIASIKEYIFKYLQPKLGDNLKFNSNTGDISFNGYIFNNSLEK